LSIFVKTSALLRSDFITKFLQWTTTQNTYSDVPQLCEINAILPTENIYIRKSVTVEGEAWQKIAHYLLPLIHA